ncbi:hypothetical protein [Ammoniphilus sp. CFH 90114]|uniref:hypothetical protein n=1 Tax=Ammoniphilus sp. CFH 90114 TaxID=2493665 RepID=UPI00100E68AE|nr:hypothetical protein [Ammoniphilus sp. CFH 90114]RXT13647.1 hypothetical protein EIZ39_05710 [Ammoniphilus sp. CFH 90114]
MKRWLGISLLWALLAIPWTGQAETWREAFQYQVTQWAQELALQDPRFSPLLEASLNHQGLGPNSKQWLVTFSADNKHIGYMVVEEDPNGFALLEYGLGEYTLFDQETLDELQSNQQKISMHYSGLESVWLDEERIYDAKSGERYPLEAGIPKTDISSAVRKGALLHTAVNHESIPYEEGWIKPGEVIKQDVEFIDKMSQGEVAYIARLFQNTVTAPFKVVGYHHWEDQLFIELDDYGSRYIPFQYALQMGHFYE